MKTVVFCRDDPRHVYFANKVRIVSCARTLVVQRSHSFTERFLGFPAGARRLNEFWKFLRQKGIRKNQKERVFFFGKDFPQFKGYEQVLDVFDINDTKVEDLIRQYSPDLILTFGCGILKKDIFFKVPKFGIVNLHSGIVPQYRGVDNVYWCLYNSNPQMIGVTVHYVDRTIDTGEILAQVFPRIEAKDNEISLFNRTVKVGIDLFTEVLKDFYLYEKKLVGEKQSYLGKLYQEKDRTFLTDCKVCKFLLSGKLKAVQREEKRVFFTREYNKCNQKNII